MKEMNAEHQDGYCYGDPSALECMYDTSRDEKEEKEEENIRRCNNNYKINNSYSSTHLNDQIKATLYSPLSLSEARTHVNIQSEHCERRKYASCLHSKGSLSHHY